MFEIKKVRRGRKFLKLITDTIFKLFQLRLKYKESRPDYGIEIFEYFYLPWTSDESFNLNFNLISKYTLNPRSRLYTIYDLSKKYLQDNTTFIEVGTWKGGVCGLISLSNSTKEIEIIGADTFSGVKKATNIDTFFKNNEYNDATIEDIKKVESISYHKINVIKGVFPESIESFQLKKPISFAHIDVDTYLSAKESFEYISSNLISGGVIILDDYGGWFTDGVTKFGKEIMLNPEFFSVPNHLGQLIIFKK